MSGEIQKAMDYLIGQKDIFQFLDDILIVSKRSEEEHKQYVLNCPKRIIVENLGINLPKCHFSKLENDWLCYPISQPSISPIKSKTSAILALEAPETLNKLRSFLGSVH